VDKFDANDRARRDGPEGVRDDFDRFGAEFETTKPNGRTHALISFLDPAADWLDKPIPPREWVVPDVIPAANVTLLTGHGSSGKTTLALQLAAATVLGCGWLNHMPEHGPAMVICCEDDEAELRRRLASITKHMGVSFGDFRGSLHFAGNENERSTRQARLALLEDELAILVYLGVAILRPGQSRSSNAGKQLENPQGAK
jgi:hypothetical protein